MINSISPKPPVIFLFLVVSVFSGVYILIAVGAVMMLVGFLGCYGAIQESQCLLGTVSSSLFHSYPARDSFKKVLIILFIIFPQFFFFLVILFACEVAAAIWGFMNRDTVNNTHTEML